MKRKSILLSLIVVATIICHAQSGHEEWKLKSNTDMYPDANGGETLGTKVYVTPLDGDDPRWGMNEQWTIEGLSDGRILRHEMCTLDGVVSEDYVYCTTIPGKIKKIVCRIKYIKDGCLVGFSESKTSKEIIEIWYDGGVVYLDQCEEIKYCEPKSPPTGITISTVTSNGEGITYVGTTTGDIYSISENGDWEQKSSLAGYIDVLGAFGSIVSVTSEIKNIYTSYVSTDGGDSFIKIDMGDINEWIGAIIKNPAIAGSFFIGGSEGTLLEYNVFENTLIQYKIDTKLGINAGFQAKGWGLDMLSATLPKSYSSSSYVNKEKLPLKSAKLFEEENATITAIFVGDKGLYLFAKSDGTLSEPKQIPGCNEGLKGVEASYFVTTDTISPTSLKKSVALVAYAWGPTSLWEYNEVVDSAYYNLAVSEDTIEIPWTGTNTITFNIASNVNWAITSTQGWLATEPVSGSGDATVSLVAGSNPTFDARTGTLTITGSEGLVQTIVVTQAGAVPFLSVSVGSLTLAGTGDGGNESTFDVGSNISWSVLSGQSWLTVNPASGSGNGTVVVVAEANPITSERTATVTVSADGVDSQIITITQAAGAATLTVAPLSLNFEAKGGSQVLTLTSNTGWTIDNQQSWLTINPVSGTGDSIITLTVEANRPVSERTATVTVSADGVASQIITITQAAGAATLTVAPLSLNFEAKGGSQVLTLTSNTGWTIDNQQSWLTINPVSGTGDSVITLTVEANPTVSERTATVTVSADGVASQIITLTQAAGAATLTVTPLSLNFDAKGDSQVLTLKSNTGWTVTCNQSWLTIQSASGFADALVSLSAEANTTPALRTALVSVSAEGVSAQQITVEQASGMGAFNHKFLDFWIYPNPFVSGFYVECGNQPVTLSVFDITGRLRYTTRLAGNDYLPADFLRPGLYFIEIQSVTSRSRIKVIKQ